MEKTQLAQIVGESWVDIMLPMFNDRRMIETQTKLYSLTKNNIKFFNFHLQTTGLR